VTKLTRPLESSTRKIIDQILVNLGWITDEKSPECNVFTERAKTVEQDEKFGGDDPDYVLYQSGTDNPIAVVEAKREGEDVDKAISDAERKYARPLGVKIVFAYDGAFFKSWHTEAQQELRVDGITVTQLISEKKVLRFLSEGPNISEVTPVYRHSRAELISIFKWANNLLRKEGLREGPERFTEFANLLFLKLISELEVEREKEGEERILAPEYCWESFAHLEQKPMMNYINDTVLPKLVKEYNHSGDVFQKQLLIKNPKTLVQIVEKLSSINLLDADSDVKGDAFEYFLKNSITIGNDLGEYFTPRHLVNLMIELVGPKFGETVYDPTCGTGGFLIASFNYLSRRCAKTKQNIDQLKNRTIYGGEITNTAKIAKMNMIITGDGHTNIKQQDSLEHPVSDTYSVVLANPPYGQPTDFGGYYPVPSNNGDAVFIQHIFKSLLQGGRAAVVVPEGLLFREGDMQKVREYILTNAKIVAVISLPRGVFRPYVKSNKTNIVIFEKDPKGTKSVWFYNMRADGFDLTSDHRKPVPENDIPDLLGKWADKPESLNSWNVTIDKIRENDFKLIALQYEPKNRRIRSDYPKAPFSSIMKEAKKSFTIDDKQEYQRVTVKLHGNGIFERDRVTGLELEVKEQKLTKERQFVVAAIDAKMGGYGVLPKGLEGSIVSSHYYLFDLDTSKVLPDYFDYIVRFGPYEDLIRPLASGTTNYADVRPYQITDLMLPLPELLTEQKAIVDEIDRQVNIKANAQSTLNALEDAAIDSTFFKSDEKVILTDVANIEPNYGLTLKSSAFFVEMANLDEDRGEISFEDREVESSGLSRFREDDILFARITPCTENGKVAISHGLGEETGLGSTEFVVISPDKMKVLPKWLYFYLKSYEVRKAATDCMIGTTARKRVPPEFFENLEVPNFSKVEQERQVKELEAYIEAKVNLKKVIRLSEMAIKNIVGEVCQLEVVDRELKGTENAKMNGFI
jgi:type I restriction enzyme M protein